MQSQFYISVANTLSLDGQYTVFGQVTSGLNIVEFQLITLHSYLHYSLIHFFTHLFYHFFLSLSLLLFFTLGAFNFLSGINSLSSDGTLLSLSSPWGSRYKGGGGFESATTGN